MRYVKLIKIITSIRHGGSEQTGALVTVHKSQKRHTLIYTVRVSTVGTGFSASISGF